MAVPTITQSPYALAAECVGKLWTHVVANDGPRPQAIVPVVCRGVFSADQLGAFQLPIDGDRRSTQGVALATEAGLTRPETEDRLHQEYASAPRTRVYESLGANSDGWFSIAQLLFARLARCAVVVTVYQSARSDQTLGRHIDLWYGVVTQCLGGSKTWHLEPPGCQPRQITLNPGDVLLMPQGVWHDVTTPTDESVHLLFALDTNRPLSSLAGS